METNLVILQRIYRKIKLSISFVYNNTHSRALVRTFAQTHSNSRRQLIIVKYMCNKGRRVHIPRISCLSELSRNYMHHVQYGSLHFVINCTTGSYQGSVKCTHAVFANAEIFSIDYVRLYLLETYTILSRITVMMGRSRTSRFV